MSDAEVIALGLFQLGVGFFCGWVVWGRHRAEASDGRTE